MPVPVGKFYHVGKVIALFVGMGCELRHSNGQLENEDGPHNFRFLYNPENEGLASLSRLDDGDQVSEHMIENWQRLLDIVLPLGNIH
jgi:hypothetical protein